MSAAPRDDAPVSELLAVCLEQLSLGGEDVLDRLCDEHPDQAADLRERMARLRALGLVGGGDDGTPERVGPFGLAGLLGHGGMGRVYLAQQTEPVRRVAAVKLMHGGMDAEALLRRFDAERQALALLTHPGIAQVYEAGATDDGRPWFAMEFVEGAPLTDWCDEQGLDVTARLELFLQLCDAVTHAHQNGILHRDLKPSNVLVTERGGRPLVKVIDFGLAKALEDDGLLLTQAGQVVGTPGYMSPEQAGVGDAVVDTRSDQYALGVVLYELLTGELPLRPDVERPDTLLAMQELLRDAVPEPPSRRVADPARARALRGDLDWITGRALEKDRERRYGSVSELAEDVRRHLRTEPVAAGPPSTTYRLGRLLRRHRREAAVGAAGLVGLLVAFVFIAWLAVENFRQLEAFDLLALGEQLDALEARADDALWPETPELLADFDAWITEAEGLVEGLPRTRAMLEALAARAEPGDGLPVFANARDQVLYEDTLPLLARLEDLAAPDGRLADVRARRDWAAGLQALTLDAPAAAWAETIADVAGHALYGGLELAPQLGLVPLGRDPVSTLHEFALPRRGEVVPTRGADGRLATDGACAVVLVLIPGGTFVQGAQNADPDGPCFLAEPTANERDGETITLAPYLLSKYELTQGQYQRLTGENPSRFAEGERHPVERVSWLEARRATRRLGAALPTGAQWEYAARAGTPWPWWHGPDPVPPGVVANLADAAAEAELGGDAGIRYEPDYDDGFATHAPVGSFPANPFGLHDVIGNLWEWCADPGLPYAEATSRRGDGLQVPLPDVAMASRGRQFRGGSFYSNYSTARSTFRHDQPEQSANIVAGLRPARALSGTDGAGAPP